MSISILLLVLSPAIAAELRFVAIVYRHGDRSPISNYPNNPLKNATPWIVDPGELTNRGKLQHYAFGQWLRSRYSNFISDDFNPSEVIINSTDVDRTLMSAQANLAGMFPPIDTSVWNRNLLWQPIPVHTNKADQDAVLAMKKPCLAYDQELKRYYQSDDYQKVLLKYKSLMQYLTDHTGMTIDTIRKAFYIYDILLIEQSYGLELPEWTKNVFPDKLHELSVTSFLEPTATPVLKRLLVSPFIKELTTLMQKVTEPNNKLKMQIYSAHDDTIGDILNSLGMFNFMLPPYTATLFFELYSEQDDRGTDELFIRILYRNFTNTLEEPHVLNIPNCGKSCSLKNFKTLYRHMLDFDWDLACKISFYPEWFLTVGFITCFAIGSLVLFTIARNICLRKPFVKKSAQLPACNNDSV